MNVRAIVALVRKDLRIFFGDRRAVLLSFAAPIVIASFFGFLFSGSSDKAVASRIPIEIANHDSSAISANLVQALTADASLAVTTATDAAIKDAVRQGRIAVGIMIPPGFGEAAGRAFFSAQAKPTLDLLYDLSRGAEVGMVRGILTGQVMQTVSQEMFSGQTGRTMIDQAIQRLDRDSGLSAADRTSLRALLESARHWYRRADAGPSAGRVHGLSIPYTVAERAITARRNVAYNGFAHAFAGMSTQFVLFASLEVGLGILLERQRGLWKRLRSAPLSKSALLAARTASGALIAIMTYAVSFAFGMLVFHIRIEGSAVGFVAIIVSCSLMTAAFGLLIAALGRTPQAARGVSVFGLLLMVMLGGAWVPTFLFPPWLQTVTLIIPVRWAVDGLEAMTWRGLGFGSAVAPTLVLLGFAALFGGLAIARFRWEED